MQRRATPARPWISWICGLDLRLLCMRVCKAILVETRLAPFNPWDSMCFSPEAASPAENAVRLAGLRRFFGATTTTTATTPKEPNAGWGKGCPDKCSKNVVAQSGCKQRCKPCDADLHSRLAAANSKERRQNQKVCASCKNVRELSGHFCKPCIESRGCYVQSRGGVNANVDAEICAVCVTYR